MAQRSVPLTAAGRTRLEEELAQLRDRAAELAIRIQEETESGDVSDNSEYEELKDLIAITDARIEELVQTLEHAVPIEPVAADGTVRLGSTVTIRDDEGIEETWMVVSHAEANTLEGSISTDSPVGKALLGCKEGETATVVTPAGEMRMTIVRVA
jgi:transcription elongation factor GreA